MNERFDGFSVNIFLDDDGDWLAHLVELPEVSAFADTPEKAFEELYIAWGGVKEAYIALGRPVPVSPKVKDFSGQFSVRIDKRVHKALAIEAAESGITLNALVAQKLYGATQQKDPHKSA
jgi:predicted HicB family RNase H-like nuclease